jgi:thioredoxin-related protein
LDVELAHKLIRIIWVIIIIIIIMLLAQHINNEELNWIDNFYMCMYACIPVSPHNVTTTGNVLILLFSPINDNCNFSWNYY